MRPLRYSAYRDSNDETLANRFVSSVRKRGNEQASFISVRSSARASVISLEGSRRPRVADDIAIKNPRRGRKPHRAGTWRVCNRVSARILSARVMHSPVSDCRKDRLAAGARSVLNQNLRLNSHTYSLRNSPRPPSLSLLAR